MSGAFFLSRPSPATEDRVSRERLHRERVDARVAALREELSRLFPGGAPATPCTLELGCGHGHFLTAFARQHPGEVCLGVDYSADRIRRACRKQQRAVLPRLHFLRAEVREFLRALPAEVKFSRVYMLFPDPWPKKRHAKHRMLGPAMLDELAARCPPGADLFFRTDSDDYFAEVDAMVAAHPAWQRSSNPTWPFDHVTVFQARLRHHRSLWAVRTA